jgi:hypothetical protein
MGMAVGIELLSLSINNVLSHLKLQAGTSAETVQFLWPTGPDHAFEAPFEMSFTVGEMSGGAVLDVEDIYQRSAENILSTYDKRQT